MLRLRSRCLRVALLGSAIVAGLAVEAGAQAAAPAADTLKAPVTFAKPVAVIFQQKCQECHRPGGMAPMSRVDYQAVRPWARSIKARVASREMPPWFLDRTVGTRRFKNDISLTDAEIDTIVRWVDAGAPLGGARDLPPAKQWSAESEWQLNAMLGPPDLVVKAPAFTMPAQASDQWPNAIVDLGRQHRRTDQGRHEDGLRFPLPRFSFNWMVNYIYADDSAPLLPKGAIIHNVMWHDNTAANKVNPDPRQWVGYGARSVDEMAHLNAQLVFITDAEYQRLRNERRKNSKDAR